MNMPRTRNSGPRQGLTSRSMIAVLSPKPAMSGRIGAKSMPAASTGSRNSAKVAIRGL
jgi:hypothetical protein